MSNCRETKAYSNQMGRLIVKWNDKKKHLNLPCWAALLGPASPVFAQPQDQRKSPETVKETSMV